MLESDVKYLKKNGTKEDWEEIQRKYPDAWALLTHVKRENGKIVKFNLLALSEKKDFYKYIDKYRDLAIGKEIEKVTYADEYTEMWDDIKKGNFDNIDFSNIK